MLLLPLLLLSATGDWGILTPKNRHTNHTGGLFLATNNNSNNNSNDAVSSDNDTDSNDTDSNDALLCYYVMMPNAGEALLITMEEGVATFDVEPDFGKTFFWNRHLMRRNQWCNMATSDCQQMKHANWPPYFTRYRRTCDDDLAVRCKTYQDPAAMPPTRTPEPLQIPVTAQPAMPPTRTAQPRSHPNSSAILAERQATCLV